MGLIGKKNISNAHSMITYYVVYPWESDFNLLSKTENIVRPCNGAGSFFILDKDSLKNYIKNLISSFTQFFLVMPDYSKKEIENIIKSCNNYREVLSHKDLLYISKKELIDSL